MESTSENNLNTAREMTDDERRAIYDFILAYSVSGVRKHGSFQAASLKFNRHPDTISRLWKRGAKSLSCGDLAAKICRQKKGIKKQRYTF